MQVFVNEVGEDIREAQDGLTQTFLDALKRIDQESNAKVTKALSFLFSLPDAHAQLHNFSVSPTSHIQHAPS